MSRRRQTMIGGAFSDVRPQQGSPASEAGNNVQEAGLAARAVPVQRRAVSRKRASAASPSTIAAGRPRRDRGPNWTQHEMLALVDAKREEYMHELDCANARDLMESDTTKWERISTTVMAAGYSPIVRDHAMCKGKWNLIILEYRRIVDYHARTGTNHEVYWTKSTEQHVYEGLPKSFSKDLYVRIDEWFGQRPQILPPHVRDLLSPTDANYKKGNDLSDDDMEIADEQEVGQSSFSASRGNHHRQHRSSAMGCGRGMSPSPGPVPIVPLPTPPMVTPKQGGPTCLASKQSPILLTTSESSGSPSQRRFGSTGIRRRSSAAQVAIAEAAKSTGDVMVAQMKDMVGATRETESKKLEVQLKLFSENMLYQREKDRRLYEQGLIATENARLAILKQGESVVCLSNISKVLSEGLKVSHAQVQHTGTGSVPCPDEEVNKDADSGKMAASASVAARRSENDL